MEFDEVLVKTTHVRSVAKIFVVLAEFFLDPSCSIDIESWWILEPRSFPDLV